MKICVLVLHKIQFMFALAPMNICMLVVMNMPMVIKNSYADENGNIKFLKFLYLVTIPLDYYQYHRSGE